MKRSYAILLGLAMSLAAASANARELIENFTGDKSGATHEFDAQAPWIVDWWVTSEYRTGTATEVTLINADTGQDVGYVLNTTGTGNGVKLIDESGRFYFRVDSSLVSWHLKVEQLTRDEAKLYTPKEPQD